MDNIFEKATRLKLRFAMPGKAETLSIEELWQLSLNDLDQIAQSVNKKLKEEKGEESFIGKKKKTNIELSLKLEILKSIIDTKMEEEEKAKLQSEKKSQIAFLEDLLNKKKIDKMEGMSMAAIEKRLAALKEDE